MEVEGAASSSSSSSSGATRSNPAVPVDDIYQGFVGRHYEKIFAGLIDLSDRDRFYTKLMLGKGEVHRYKLSEVISRVEEEGPRNYVFLRTYTSGHEVNLVGNTVPNRELGLYFVTQHMVRGDVRAFLRGTLAGGSVETEYDAFYFKDLSVEVIVSKPFMGPEGKELCLVEIKFCSANDEFQSKATRINQFRNSLFPFTGFIEKSQRILNEVLRK